MTDRQEDAAALADLAERSPYGVADWTDARDALISAGLTGVQVARLLELIEDMRAYPPEGAQSLLKAMTELIVTPLATSGPACQCCDGRC